MQNIEQLREALDMIADMAWRGADSNDDAEMVQHIKEADERIESALDELERARERIAALESIVKDTAKIGTYYHHAHRYYACPGCNGFVIWGDKTPLEHEDDCPIKAARALLTKGTAGQ